MDYDVHLSVRLLLYLTHDHTRQHCEVYYIYYERAELRATQTRTRADKTCRARHDTPLRSVLSASLPIERGRRCSHAHLAPTHP